MKRSPTKASARKWPQPSSWCNVLYGRQGKGLLHKYVRELTGCWLAPGWNPAFAKGFVKLSRLDIVLEGFFVTTPALQVVIYR